MGLPHSSSTLSWCARLLMAALCLSSGCSDPPPPADIARDDLVQRACEAPSSRTAAELDSLRAAVRPGQRSALVTSLPEPVSATRDALLAAAREADFEQLRALSGGRVFRETSGPEPGPDWLDPGARGSELIPLLITAALVDAAAVRFEDVERDGAFVYVWPVYSAADGLRLGEHDRACIQRFYGDDVAAGVERTGTFVGPSVGIASDGEWVSFVAGGS